jgi:hypothetical protein
VRTLWLSGEKASERLRKVSTMRRRLKARAIASSYSKGCWHQTGRQLTVFRTSANLLNAAVAPSQHAGSGIAALGNQLKMEQLYFQQKGYKKGAHIILWRLPRLDRSAPLWIRKLRALLVEHDVDCVRHVEVEARDRVAARVLPWAPQRNVALRPQVCRHAARAQHRREVQVAGVGAREVRERQLVQDVLRTPEDE